MLNTRIIYPIIRSVSSLRLFRTCCVIIKDRTPVPLPNRIDLLRTDITEDIYIHIAVYYGTYFEDFAGRIVQLMFIGHSREEI